MRVHLVGKNGHIKQRIDGGYTMAKNPKYPHLPTHKVRPVGKAIEQTQDPGVDKRKRIARGDTRK